jgi:hypothetical protein
LQRRLLHRGKPSPSPAFSRPARTQRQQGTTLLRPTQLQQCPQTSHSSAHRPATAAPSAD